MASMLTIKEAAEYTRYAEGTFRRIYKGLFPYYIVGKRVLFDADELTGVLKAQRVPATRELLPD